jgi:hypothetical protein
MELPLNSIKPVYAFEGLPGFPVHHKNGYWYERTPTSWKRIEKVAEGAKSGKNSKIIASAASANINNLYTGGKPKRYRRRTRKISSRRRRV